MIPLSVYLYVEMAGGGLLALWVIARFPKRGPKSVISAVLGVFLAGVLSSFAGWPIVLVKSAPYGVYLCLLGIVLPIFFSFFLTTGWLLRSVLGTVGGRGGGGGHTVRA